MEAFPSVSSYLRLIASYLMEYMEDRANEYAWSKTESFSRVTESSLAQAANRALKWRDCDGQNKN